MQNPLSNNSLLISPANAQNIAYGAELLRGGGLVAFPTETVYGLGADAENEAAVRTIYTTKGRPAHNPLIVHVSDVAMAEHYGVMTASARMFAPFFMQGLSLVCPVREGSIAESVKAGGSTVALRIPQHPTAKALLEAFGAGIAAPSANRSGRVSPTTAEHVAAEFAENQGALRLILDGGACDVGVESTVVDCSTEIPRLLRAGSIALERLREVIPISQTEHRADATLRSPGLLESHYAPNAHVRLNAIDVKAGEALLAFGAPTIPHHGAPTFNLTPSGDLMEAAHHLYDYLRRLDESGAHTIAVMPIPHKGIGMAINDRLKRAAAGR
jgi:L-threonylcarbamoyladenylate synthase